MNNFFFPPLCLHCSQFVEKKKALFCNLCTEFFEPLNPKERCIYCFEECELRRCRSCLTKNSMPVAAVWENFGPINCLIQKLEREKSFLALNLAISFLSVQFSKLSFPHPDIIMPLPASLLSRIIQGDNTATFLAKSLSQAMKVPYIHGLKKRGNQFYLKDDFDGKKVLLIDVSFSKEKIEMIDTAFFARGDTQVYGLSLVT